MEIWRSRILSSAQRTKSWSPMTSSEFQEITSHVSNCFKQKRVPRITYADGSMLRQVEMPFEAFLSLIASKPTKNVEIKHSNRRRHFNSTPSSKTTQSSSQWSFLFKSCHRKTRDEGAKNGKLSVDAENLSEYTNLMPRIFTIKTMFCYAADAFTGLRFSKLVTRKLRRLNSKQNTKRQPLNFSRNSFSRKIENVAKIHENTSKKLFKASSQDSAVINWINFSFPANFSGLMNWTLFFSRPKPSNYVKKSQNWWEASLFRLLM